MDAFKHIADLHGLLPQPLSLDPLIAKWTIEFDRPEMLDEYIRRTGYGLLKPSDKTGEEVAEANRPPAMPVRTHMDNMSWRRDREWGKDTEEENIISRPMMWQAVRANAPAVMKYLAGPGPLAAYQAYVSAHEDEQAQKIREVLEKESDIRVRLGWGLDALNESSLAVAVIFDNLAVAKLLFELAPESTAECIHAR